MSARAAFLRRLLGVTALAAVLAAGMLALGWWQWSRYDASQQAASAQARAAAVAAAPVALSSVVRADQAFPAEAVGRKVLVTGRYGSAADQFLVRGHRLRGRPGYWVLTPLRVRRSAILVVRGWLATADAPAPIPSGRVRVTGWLEPPQAAPVGPPTGPARATRVIRDISTAVLVARVPYDLYSGYVVMSAQMPPEPRLAKPALPSPPPSSAAGWRNLAYAGQWLLFAGFVIFMWWRFVREPRVA
jgi:surfeit locus 1 family protein